MYKLLFRTGRNLAIVIVLTILAAQGIIHFDPYGFAEEGMAATLASRQGFEDRLTRYGNEARQWRAVMKPGVEAARSVCTVTESLKALGLWEGLLGLVGDVPGGRAVLEKVDEVAHTLLALDGSLDKVALAPTTAGDLRRLRSGEGRLGRERLRQVYRESSAIAQGLTEVSQQLGAASDAIRGVTDAPQYAEIMTSLDPDRGSERSGLLKAPSSRLHQAMEDWSGMPTALDALRQRIDEDVSTLNAIRAWYAAGAFVDRALDSLYVRPAAAWVNQRVGTLLTALSLCVAISAGGWVGSFLVERARWRGLTRRRVIVVDRRPKRQRFDRARGPRGRRASPDDRGIERFPTEATRARKIAGADDGHASIRCHWADGRREILRLPDSDTITVGSGLADDVQTRGSASAASQVSIQRARTRYYVEVLNDAFPTVLNGRPIASARSVSDGDLLDVGDVAVIFSI